MHNLSHKHPIENQDLCVVSHLFFLWQVLGSKHFGSLLWSVERTVSYVSPKATAVCVPSLDEYSFEVVAYSTREFAFPPVDLGFSVFPQYFMWKLLLIHSCLSELEILSES